MVVQSMIKQHLRGDHCPVHTIQVLCCCLLYEQGHCLHVDPHGDNDAWRPYPDKGKWTHPSPHRRRKASPSPHWERQRVNTCAGSTLSIWTPSSKDITRHREEQRREWTLGTVMCLELIDEGQAILIRLNHLSTDLHVLNFVQKVQLNRQISTHFLCKPIVIDLGEDHRDGLGNHINISLHTLTIALINHISSGAVSSNPLQPIDLQSWNIPMLDLDCDLFSCF